MNRILVVEDEPALRQDLVEYLSLLGYASKGVASCRELIEVLDAEAAPDVVILDVGLSDGSGFDMARDIRGRCDCGVIMLTALGEREDRITGFDSGADLYLVKPASLQEIRAGVQSLLRRLSNPAKPGLNEAGTWCLNTVDWHLAAPGGKAIKLTATELSFLTALFERVGQPCSRDWLAQAIVRPQAAADFRNLDTVVNRLRRATLSAEKALSNGLLTDMVEAEQCAPFLTEFRQTLAPIEKNSIVILRDAIGAIDGSADIERVVRSSAIVKHQNV